MAAGDRQASSLKGAISLAAVGGLLAIGAAVGSVWVDRFSAPSCQLSPGGCPQIPLFMKIPLVAAHLLAFFLLPCAMHVFHSRSQALEEAGAQSPFMALLGLSYLMVAIGGEVGWHVTQDWFYSDGFCVLNGFFYMFLILGTALWTVGIKKTTAATAAATPSRSVDYFLLASPLLAGLLYLLGASVLHTKLPIYILLCIQYAVLTWRFWKLLNTPEVLLFPLFSVGANLAFIALLNAHQQSTILNPLFHTLHDIAGTELGVAVIAYLTYVRMPPNKQAPHAHGT